MATRGGSARQYVHALLHDLPAGTVCCGQPATAIDLAAREVITPKRRLEPQAMRGG